MKHRLLLAALCLILPLQSIAQENDVEIYLSSIELEEIFNNPNDSYICLSKDVSYLPYIIEKISNFDANQESPVHALKKHMDLGWVIGRENAVVEVLKYAELVLNGNQKTNDDEDLEDIAKAFDMVLHQVMQGFLTLNAEKLAFLQNNSLKNDTLLEDDSDDSLQDIVVTEEVLAE